MVLREGGDYNQMIAGVEPPPQEPVPEAPVPEERKEGWVHAHPYLASVIAFGALVVLGIFLVAQRTHVAPSSSSGAWGGAGGMFFGNIRDAAQYRPTAEDVTRAQSTTQAVSFIPLPTPSIGQETEPVEQNADIAALLALLVQPSGSAEEPFEPTEPDAYSFIPQGMVSVEVPTTQRTPAQDTLFGYGNAVGTYIKGFEDTRPNMPQILKDHVEDRTNTGKIAAVRHLGVDLAQLGVDLLSIQGVPGDAQAMHHAYATTYRIVGTNLTKVAESTTDEEFLDAIIVYNASVEDLTKRFLVLVALFSANDVTFSSSDPGSMFMFNPNLSLMQ